MDKPFAAKNTLIFCAACYDAEFASRCDACGDTFRPGMKKMEYKTKKWHDKCFQCVVCKQQVGSKPFIIPNDTDVYCVGCFEEKFATKCTKCKKIMTTGGVTFKNEVRNICKRKMVIQRFVISFPIINELTLIWCNFRRGIENALFVRNVKQC